MGRAERSWLERYGVALLTVLLALLLMLLLNPWIPMRGSPFLLFFAAVMVSAWYGGIGAGLLATTLAAFSAIYFFLPPIYKPYFSDPADLARLGMFLVVSLMIVSFSAARRQLVKALQRERDLVSTIVDTAGSFIVVLDRSGNIVQFNRACEHMTGYAFADVRGRCVWDFLLLNEAIEPVKQIFHTLCATATPSTHENIWVAKDGSHHLIAWANTVLLDSRGSVRYVIGTGLDITERKQAETALQEANQALQALIQASPVAITVLDQSGIVHMWNPAAVKMFGWSAEEVLDRKMPTVPDEKQAEFLENIALTLDGALLNGSETYRQRKDGSFIYVGLWTAMLRGAAAADDRIMSIVADLSERKQVEAALKLSQERLTSFVEANVVGIVFCDTNGAINEANDEFLRLVGYTRADIQAGSLRWSEMTPAEYRVQDEQQIARTQRGEDCPPFEKEYIRKDGSRVPVLVGFGLFGEARQQAIVFILDLTERKRLEETLRTQTVDLAQANRIKDEFLAVLSHELRTPLNSILGWARLLRTRQFDAAATARALETIERNARLQNQLIDDILDVSKIIQGKLRLKPRPVDLADVIAAAIDAMRPAAAAKSIEINDKVSSEPNGEEGNFTPISSPSAFKVLGDADRLQQVLWNLLSNAIKFTATGGRVTLKLERVASKIQVQNPKNHGILTTGDASSVPVSVPFAPSSFAQITVSDTGQGISADFLPFVFDRFRQADSSSTRIEGGLGIGLAIVRHLIELHGGTVQAHSPGIGEGSTFVLRLPLLHDRQTERQINLQTNGVMVEPPASKVLPGDRPHPALATALAQERQPAISPIAGVETVSDRVASHSGDQIRGLLAGRQILIVDDEPDTRALLQQTMEHYGAIVTVAASAAEALNLLTQPQRNGRTPPWKPDVLISDIGMPHEDGYTFMRRVRALYADDAIALPALALTAYASQEDSRNAIASGFQQHLAKPIDPAMLAQAISALIDSTVAQNC